MKKSQENIFDLIKHSTLYEDKKKFISSLQDIISFVSFDGEMEKFFKANNFASIFNDIVFEYIAPKHRTSFSKTFTTKTMFLTFKHTYTAILQDNIYISFSKGNADYQISFLIDNYQKYFDKEIRNSKDGISKIDNTIFKFCCKIKDARIDELSKKTKNMHIGYFKDYVVMESNDYISLTNVITNKPYDHPVNASRDIYALSKEKN